MLHAAVLQRVALISLIALLSTSQTGQYGWTRDELEGQPAITNASRGDNDRLKSANPPLAAGATIDVQEHIWHVATNGSDITGDGSEAKPFATIQHGINLAANGDTVLVHPGVYRENINFNGKNITVGSLFVTSGDEDYILQTVIDGNRTGPVVTFVSGESATAKLTGLTIANGYAYGAGSASYGGGIACHYSSPTLTHLRVSGNEAVQEGGGLYFEWCSATVQDVLIANNLAGAGGGGIRYSYGSVNLENAVIAHNASRGGGAGIQFYHSEGTITNTLISDNLGGAKGGGLHFDGCSPTFVHVTVAGNWTAGQGGGLNVSYYSQPTLVNSIVWGNSPEQIYYDTDWPGEAITIEYSDVQDGAAGIVTNGHGPVYWGAGNLEAAPHFVSSNLANYRLANNSPAINAGKVSGAPLTDIEGNVRPNPVGSKPDLGAYENPAGQLRFTVFLPLLLKASSPVSSTEQIYFSAGDVLYRMNLDGSEFMSVSHGAAGSAHLAADRVHHKIYLSRWDAPAQILAYDVQGSGTFEVVADGPGYGGQGLAIDPAGPSLYLGLYYAGVYVKDMNPGGNWTQLVDSSALYPMLGQRGQLQIDPANHQIYFRSAFNGECGECRYIWRVNSDGTQLVKLIPANGGDALALDLTGRQMYFSDVPGNGTIKRAGLDGSQGETVLIIPAPYRFCRSIALDLEHGKMVLSLFDEASGYTRRAIARANLDGSGFEILRVITGTAESELTGGVTLF